MRENIVIGICALSAVLGAGACSRGTTYTSKDGSVTVEKKGPDQSSMTFTGKDGQKVEINTGGGKIPDDFPKDAPVYEGTKVVMSQSANEKNTHTLVLESSDPADKISDFYKKGLESNGWKIDSSMNVAQMSMVTASKDKRQAVVQVMNGPDKRTINQVLSDKP
jgi:hypothetical protein